MTRRTPYGFCAPSVSALSGLCRTSGRIGRVGRRTGVEIGNLIAKWASQAQSRIAAACDLARGAGGDVLEMARGMTAASANGGATLEMLEGRTLLSSVSV